MNEENYIYSINIRGDLHAARERMGTEKTIRELWRGRLDGSRLG
jgi:hypothetical protein